ncbi:MAG: hypothetical protein D6746_16845 [Bacteroidetes bacterium]|nr:MAG: hypothetical protein D6746_16845 [Bacteroidota bacterium]
MLRDERFLILGGAGLVGSQIVREVSRQLRPKKIVVASLLQEEVETFLGDVREEFPDIEFVGAWGNIFVRDDFRLASRGQLLDDPAHREALYEDLFGDLEATYERSVLVRLIREHRPDVIVDCINTATAISYQDVESISKKTHDALGQLRAAPDDPETRTRLEHDVSTLLISQATSQLIRHARLLHRAMCEVGTRVYVKVGTTGTGGMGLNIPYTHSEDKPSVQLMTKTAMAFAHTGLLFLMARTPGGPLVKELKPAAMIGYRRVAHQVVKRRGRPQQVYESRVEPLEGRLVLRDDEHRYQPLGPLMMAGVDTGENGFFARGEFETITHIDQMEFLTPEEIAEQVVLEIQGSNTGHDIIAGVDSNVMMPSYRAGVLRHTALRRLKEIEQASHGHSVALGQLGPPELSKLLYEAHLLKLNYGTLEAVRQTPTDEIAATLFDFLEANDTLRTQIVSIGVPILAPDGRRLIRGPFINIPESIYDEVPLHPEDVDRWARKGWVDLRPVNIRGWQERFGRMLASAPHLHTQGTASITRTTYLYETIEIGAVVAWIFANEEGGYRIK